MVYFTIVWRHDNKLRAFTIGSPTERYALSMASSYAFWRNGIVIDKEGIIRLYYGDIAQLVRALHS